MSLSAYSKLTAKKFIQERLLSQEGIWGIPAKLLQLLKFAHSPPQSRSNYFKSIEQSTGHVQIFGNDV